MATVVFSDTGAVCVLAPCPRLPDCRQLSEALSPGAGEGASENSASSGGAGDGVLRGEEVGAELEGQPHLNWGGREGPENSVWVVCAGLVCAGLMCAGGDMCVVITREY